MQLCIDIYKQGFHFKGIQCDNSYNITQLVSGGSNINCHLNNYCNGLQRIQNSFLVTIPNNTYDSHCNTMFF